MIQTAAQVLQKENWLRMEHGGDYEALLSPIEVDLKSNDGDELRNIRRLRRVMRKVDGIFR